MQDFQACLLQKTKKADNTFQLFFEKPNGFSFLPGQFITIVFGPKIFRAYSIASTPNEKNIELLVKLVEGGEASKRFLEMQEGDLINFKGPFGIFELSKNKENTLNFFCTGSGIAPFRSMILHEKSQKFPRRIRLFYGSKKASELGYLQDLQTWGVDEIFLSLTQEEGDLEIIASAAKIPTENIKNYRLTEFVLNKKFDQHDEFYLCGVKQMVNAVKDQLLLSEKVVSSQVFAEKFD